MMDLSQTLGTRLAALTAPQSADMRPESIQTRRTMMDRLASARVRAESNPLVGERLLLGVLNDARDPEIREKASQELLELAVNNWPRDYRQSFLASVVPSALESAYQNNIPPSIIVAQAVLESGWGRSQLAKEHHNLFGIKASPLQGGITYPTLEATQKGIQIKQARFRQYESQAQSVAEHGKLLGQDDRYAQAREHRQNWRHFLAKLAPVYASDPQYAARITQIINQYQLDRWDGLTGPSGSSFLQT